jgi:hypothetical protein
MGGITSPKFGQEPNRRVNFDETINDRAEMSTSQAFGKSFQKR